MVTHAVLRPFNGAGADRVPGEVVDAASWRNARKLESMRMIRPLDGKPETVTVGGRVYLKGCAPAVPEPAPTGKE